MEPTRLLSCAIVSPRHAAHSLPLTTIAPL